MRNSTDPNFWWDFRKSRGWNLMQSHIAKAVIKPRRKRQLEFLQKALRPHPTTGKPMGIEVHVEGGYALKGDLQDLVTRGLLQTTRHQYGRAFRGGPLSMTVLHITDKGREELAKHG